MLLTVKTVEVVLLIAKIKLLEVLFLKSLHELSPLEIIVWYAFVNAETFTHASTVIWFVKSKFDSFGKLI